MKFIIVLILVVICGSAMCGPDEWDEYTKQCSQKHNVKLDKINDAVQGKVKEADLTPDMKCFFLCIGETAKVIKDGVLQPQVVAEKVSDKELVKKMTSECSLKGTDDCDTAFKVISCLYKNKMEKMV